MTHNVFKVALLTGLTILNCVTLAAPSAPPAHPGPKQPQTKISAEPKHNNKPAPPKPQPAPPKPQPAPPKPQPAPPKPQPAPPKPIHHWKPMPLRHGSTTPIGWFDDYNAAMDTARKFDRPVLVLFTSSDNCKWCDKLHDNVLSRKAFKDYAEDHLILLYMDSPLRVRLPREVVATCNFLRRQLKAGDGVPCTVLLAPNGSIIYTLHGYREDYLENIKHVLSRHHGFNGRP